MPTTTHELAKNLRKLANILLAAPNVPMDEIDSLLNLKINKESSNSNTFTNVLSIGEIDKVELINLIKEAGIPIQLRARDAKRDVLDKLIRYLRENPNLYSKVKTIAQERPNGGALLKALNLLLG